MGKRIEKISRSTMDKLQNYSWPGNIRELRNIIERAMIITTGHSLQVELPEHSENDNTGLKTLFKVQHQHILETLKKTNWQVRGNNGAAKVLDLKPTTLEAKMARLGITRPL